MKKPDLNTIIATVSKLIEQAEEYRKSGKLIKASNQTLRARELIVEWQNKKPYSKTLRNSMLENEKCRNKIIHDMIKSIHLNHITMNNTDK